MTREEELAHLKAPSDDPKQRQVDYWGHRAEKAEDEAARLKREIERMRLTLQDICDGYGSQHESEWCRTKAAIGLLTSMNVRGDNPEQETTQLPGTSCGNIKYLRS
jgi:hypothetical protein